MTSTGSLYVDLEESRGRQGEAALQVQGYPDSNKITTGYVWILMPLIRSSVALVQIGYSGAYQNADETRFVLPTQPYLPGDPRFDFSGRYIPYYTPINTVSHSVLAGLTARPEGGVVFRANASYGVHATEDVVTFSLPAVPTPPGNTIVRTVGSRSFNPWSGHASLELPQSGNLSFVFSASIDHTAFYTSAGTSASLALNF